MLLTIIIAALAESAASFAGGALVIFRESLARVFAHRVLGFAIGALIGVSFFDIIPQAVKDLGIKSAFLYVVFGILLFFIFERMLLWYHCHGRECDVHTYTYLILFGDAVHNFIDGVILALAFLVSVPLGIATTVAVVLHEIPQEVADFGLLMRGGYGRGRALVYNFLISLATLLGALTAYWSGSAVERILPYALALVGGNFLYIALTDLLPEVHEPADFGHFLSQLALMVGGGAVIYLITGYFGV